jgi:hypothetical protein
VTEHGLAGGVLPVRWQDQDQHYEGVLADLGRPLVNRSPEFDYSLSVGTSCSMA